MSPYTGARNRRQCKLADLNLEPHLDDPEQLERLYRHDPSAFALALQQLPATHGDHLLVRAWCARLAHAASGAPAEPRAADHPAPTWKYVVSLALCAAVCARLLLLGAESEGVERLRRFGAFVVLLPVGLILARERAARTRWDWLFGAAALAALPFMVYLPREHSQSGVLALAHLPLFLSALIFGIYAQGRPDAAARAELVAVGAEGAIYSAAILFGGALLTGLTIGIFSLIKLDIAELYFRNVVVTCVAAAPVIATGLERVRSRRGERLAPALCRIFAPLALATLVAYALALVGTQRTPYRDRDSLAVLYAMLVAIAFLVSVMLLPSGEHGPGRRVALLACAIAGLSVAIDGVALSAIIYRFASYGMSANRLAVLGGNVLLFVYLAGLTLHLLRSLRRHGDARAPLAWIGTFIPAFGVWSALWVFVFPWVFGER